MVAVVAIGVFAYLFFVLARIRGPASYTQPQPTTGNDVPELGYESPAAARLLGLLGLAISFLLLAWLYIPPPQQYLVMTQLLYPATVAVALVLLFDKATRSWSVKSNIESVREWIFCDAIVFLLVLGFLNLLRSEANDQYAVLFWDILYIMGFLFTFWMLDRKFTRYRFLVTYGYFIVLPILLLVWRQVQAVPVSEDLSWWSTVWPFFCLSLVFFVLEIISLVATRDSHTLPAIKDAVFVVLYGAALIIAIPETG